MSIWDYMRKADKAPAPQAIKRTPDGMLSIRWDDGASTRVGARAARQACPCAQCVDEVTGQRTLDPESVGEDVAFARVEPVGNYAVRLCFSDGHETGLFDWALLRRLAAVKDSAASR